MNYGFVKTAVGKAVGKRQPVILSAVLLLTGVEGDAGVPPNATFPHVQEIVDKAVNYAISNEDANTTQFNEHYKYTRTRTWVYHNAAGKLTEFKQSQTEENASQPSSRNDNPKLLVKGRDLKLQSYPITNIVARFDFSLTGEDRVNGRKAYVIEFVPRPHLTAKSEFDRLVNAATGKVWVDEADYAIVKAEFQLKTPITIAHGLVGRVDAFTCKVIRLRTPEGWWFTRRLDWHLEGRLITVRRIIDYHDDRTHQQPLSQIKDPTIKKGSP